MELIILGRDDPSNQPKVCTESGFSDFKCKIILCAQVSYFHAPVEQCSSRRGGNKSAAPGLPGPSSPVV